jgi:transcription initiation factor TFIIF subunit beta
MKPKAMTKMVAGKGPTGVIQAGSHAPEKFQNFVVRIDTFLCQNLQAAAHHHQRAPTADPKKARKQKEERAARLSQSELRDRIFKCFDKYSFWSMKAFKQELEQPEAWLRENLEELAVLHKTGRFANHWELKPEYKRSNLQSIEGAAPDLAPEADYSESDGDEEMEDVMPS